MGDFLAAASLITEILICLKDAGGAASEYQELMLEIDGLRRALDTIEHIDASREQVESVNNLKVAAPGCRYVWQEFLKKLKSYQILD